MKVAAVEVEVDVGVEVANATDSVDVIFFQKINSLSENCL